jgi:iron complex outermembrane recepter protein
MRECALRKLWLCLLAGCLSGPILLYAASPGMGTVTGTVLSAAGDPVRDAVVTVSPGSVKLKTTPAGKFAGELPAGTHRLMVNSGRSGSATADIVVAAGGTTNVDIALSPSFRDEIVVSAGPMRAVSEVAQPIAVLSGRELDARQQTSLGATIEHEAGVSTSYYGPAVGRPMLRGLGGDRVRLLSNGTDLGDASSQAPDHIVATDTKLASSIEILRGAATLLYGSSAGGGVVNIIDDRIPQLRLDRPITGELSFGGGSVADERRGSVRTEGSVGSVGWYAAGSRRETDDYAIPGFASLEPEEDEPHGALRNTASDASTAIGGLSWIRDTGYIGVAFARMDSTYGLPIHRFHREEDEDGEEEEEEDEEEEEEEEGEGDGSKLIMRQNRVDLRGETTLGGPLQMVRVNVSLNDYQHVETEANGEEGQRNSNDSIEGRLEARHAPLGALNGTVGVQFRHRDISVLGEEVTVPPSTFGNFAVFAFEEVARTRHRWQGGLRYEQQRSSGDDVPSRSYRDFSATVGWVWMPREAWSVGVSAGRSAKFPTAEELYSNGVILATQTFEVGDPDIRKEVNLDMDVSVRRIRGRVTGELNLFVKRFDNFIYQRVTDEEHDELPVLHFVNADAIFRGAELRALVGLLEHGGRYLLLELGLDSTRAEIRGSGEPLPRIPPLKTSAGLRYEDGRFWGEVGASHSSRQDRLAPLETPTAAYTTVQAGAGVRFFTRGAVHELILRGTNLTDEEVRSHTSFLKDFAPAPGRDVDVMYRVKF